MSSKGSIPDVVYFVKPSEVNEELRYSLRSLKNVNHGNIYLIGYKPEWVDEKYIHIPTKQRGNKYENIRENFLALLGSTAISDEFILMNDDFFVMSPTKSIPVLRRLKALEYYIGLFKKVDETSEYVTSMQATYDLLRSWDLKKLSSYELHTPMIFNKTKLRELFANMPKDFSVSHVRTLYGNYFDIGGERVRDVKVIRDDQNIPYNTQFLSTIDESFADGAVGTFLRQKFAKVLVFSHANDPDGMMAVVLAQMAFAEVDYLLTNNPQSDILAYLETVDTSQYDYIVIADIYPGKPVLKKLPYAYWFDHKQHSLDKLEQHQLTMPNATIMTDLNGRPTCATELFFVWLRGNNLLPPGVESFIEAVRQHDTWDIV